MRQTVRHGIRADEDSKVEVRDTDEYAFERRDIARRGNLKRRKTDGLAASLFDPLRQRLRLRRWPRDQHTHALQRETGVSCGHKPCRGWTWRRGAAVPAPAWYRASRRPTSGRECRRGLHVSRR